jgi:hypothetical protein
LKHGGLLLLLPAAPGPLLPLPQDMADASPAAAAAAVMPAASAADVIDMRCVAATESLAVAPPPTVDLQTQTRCCRQLNPTAHHFAARVSDRSGDGTCELLFIVR